MTLVKFQIKSDLGYHPALPTADEMSCSSENSVKTLLGNSYPFNCQFDPNQNLDPFQPFFSPMEVAHLKVTSSCHRNPEASLSLPHGGRARGCPSGLAFRCQGGYHRRQRHWAPRFSEWSGMMMSNLEVPGSGPFKLRRWQSTANCFSSWVMIFLVTQM